MRSTSSDSSDIDGVSGVSGIREQAIGQIETGRVYTSESAFV